MTVEIFRWSSSVPGAAEGRLGCTDLQGAGVGVEALLPCDPDSMGQEGSRLLLREGDDGGRFEEIVDAERGAKAGCTGGGEGVARACDVIPEDVGRVVAQEKGPAFLTRST